jgi:hypothetical protein
MTGKKRLSLKKKIDKENEEQKNNKTSWYLLPFIIASIISVCGFDSKGGPV